MAFDPLFHNVIKQTIASCAWRWSARRRRPGSIVLMYHRIGRKGDPLPHLDVDDFRRQLEWLAAHCDVIGPESLRDSSRGSSRGRVPVLLTFDDGSRDYYELAYPVLKEFGMPAVVFLITDHVDRPRLLWFDRLHLAVHASGVDRVALPWRADRTLNLGARQKDRVVSECKQYLKSVSDDAKECLLNDLFQALGSPTLPDVDRQIMNWDEVRATMDLTTYGGHTHTHPLMSRVDNARLEHEIRTCRDRIFEETGAAPTLFAYPNGDVTSDAKTLVSGCGFDIAFSTKHGLNDETTDWMEVRRVGVGHVVPTVWMMTQSWA